MPSVLRVGEQSESLILIRRSAVKSDLCTLYCRPCARENCLCRGGAEERNWTWLEGLLTIREYQNFLEEGKLVVGVASVACVVSRRYPILAS